MGDSNLDSDPDFDEIIFEDVEQYKPPFVRSTKKQRELLESLATKRSLHYAALIRRCNEILDKVAIRDRLQYRHIKDIGELSIGEADLMIKELGEIRKIK